MRVAINGFGRIGRSVFRILNAKNNVDVVAINDIFDKAALTYLLKYDTVMGRFPEDVTLEGDILKITYNKGEDERKSDNTPGREQRRYYHNGIKRSSFDFGWKVARRFELAKANAEMNNGLLLVEIPYANESKPKSLRYSIQIYSSSPVKSFSH